MAFDLESLLLGVFEPQAGETVVVACDRPRPGDQDNDDWRERRAMAAEWRDAFAALGRERGFATLPLLVFDATGSPGAPLPAAAELGGALVTLDETLLGTTLAAFLTEFSATAPLDGVCRRKPDFRAASMPGIQRWMERTSLSANYREVARLCRRIAEAFEGADALEVDFSTGERCRFDLRHRRCEVDDGHLPRFKPGDRVINLPSGETFIVPYEGERPGEPSLTEGTLPLASGGERTLLEVKGNRIVAARAASGSGIEARRLERFFAEDPARANLAEVGFGCNDRATVTGNVLEDEKAGFHWAYGRSDHLGGTMGVDAFRAPETVVHQDVVYAKGSPIEVARAALLGPGRETLVIRGGDYVLF